MTSNCLAALAASLAFVWTVSGALAHAQLEKATPPVGGAVASASEIRLEFSEASSPDSRRWS
jgi:copper resistance protein C